jgi:hypothetical protein
MNLQMIIYYNLFIMENCVPLSLLGLLYCKFPINVDISILKIVNTII